MTFGQADDLAYEFATNRVANPEPTNSTLGEVCLSRLLVRSIRAGFLIAPRGLGAVFAGVPVRCLAKTKHLKWGEGRNSRNCW